MKLWQGMLLVVLAIALVLLSSCDVVDTITGAKQKRQAYEQQQQYNQQLIDAYNQQQEIYRQQVEAYNQIQQQEYQQYEDALKAYYEAQQGSLDEAQKQLDQMQPQIIVPGQQ